MLGKTGWKAVVLLEVGRNPKRSNCPGVLGAKGRDIKIDEAVKPPCWELTLMMLPAKEISEAL